MLVIVFWKIAIHTLQKADALGSQRQVVILIWPPNLLVFENFFFHTISIKEMHKLIKCEGARKIFNENIDKSLFQGFSWMSHYF